MLDGAAFEFIRKKFYDNVDVAILQTYDPAIPVQYDNFPQIDKTNKNLRLWVSFKIVPGVSNQVSFGPENRHRNLGLAIAGVHSRILKGTEDVMTIADQIKAEFLSVKENGVTYRTPSIEQVGHLNNLGSAEPNAWYLVNVVCPYYFDHLG